MLENRQQTGWDRFLPGHGLLMTKIDYNSRTWDNNTVNNTSSNMRVDIIEADGYAPTYQTDYSGYYGKQGDCFPTLTNYNYSITSTYTLHDITERDSVIRFGFMRRLSGVDVRADYDETLGHVDGLGNYAAGATVSLTATPCDGYVFDSWDGTTSDATLTFKATNDTIVKPRFVHGGSCGQDATWKIVDSCLVIEGSGAIYDYTAYGSNSTPWSTYATEINAIAIGEGITSIGANAFNSLTAATTVTLPATLTEIRDYAFNNCTALDSIDARSTTPPSVRGSSFNNVSQEAAVSVPCGSTNDYATTWSFFTNIETTEPCEDMTADDDVTIVNGRIVVNHEGPVRIYDAVGKLIATLQAPADMTAGSGLYIVRGDGWKRKVMIR